MSSELQPALHISLPSGEFDSHLWLVFAIMVFTGILGGAANYFLNERERPKASGDWIKYPVFGVVAALTVPLFLNMIASTLLEGARTRPVDLLVFGGFCLLYVVASRHLFENLVHGLLRQIASLGHEVSAIRQKQDEAPPARSEPEAAVPPPPAPRPVVVEHDPLQIVTYQDVEILRSLADGGFVCGNLAALCERSGLPREIVSQRLGALKGQGLIETRISDKNVLNWVLSGNGKSVLEEVLGGQENIHAG